MTDPEQPIVDINALVEERIDASHGFTLGHSSVVIRHPSTCSSSIAGVSAVVTTGLTKLAQRLAPIEIPHQIDLVLLEDRDLPPNFRFPTDAPEFKQLVLAPGLCSAGDWFEDSSAWANLVELSLHELVHRSIGTRFPKKTPRWIIEGHAEYLSTAISEELRRERGLLSVPSAVHQAMFAASDPAEIEVLSAHRGAYDAIYTDPVVTWRAYELFAGAFAVDRGSHGSLSDEVVEILASGESRRWMLARLRAIDARELQETAISYRPQMIATANSLMGVPEQRPFGIRILGFLGECSAEIPAPDFGSDICNAEAAIPAPYFGSCLPEESLRGLIGTLASCGGKLDPSWIRVIEGYLSRFPSTSAEAMAPMLEHSAPFLRDFIQKELGSIVPGESE